MEYIVFYSGDKELLALLAKGYFPGEIETTRDLLACENNISPADISIKIEKGKRS